MSQLVFQSTSGGQVNLIGPTTSSTFNINVPATAGNMVTTGDTGTVTTTMLASTTGSGAVVLATSPTLVTPALGTPSALIGTNITGTAAGLSIGGNAATATTATNQSGGTTSATSIAYSTTLTGGTGIVNLGSGQFYKDANGNVGVGTSSPSNYGKFVVLNSAATSTTQYANSNIWAISNASNADSNISISNGVDHSAKIGIYNGANLYFALDGIEAMRIDSSRNVLIGKTSATYTTSGVSLSSGTNQFAWSTNSGSVVASFATPVSQSQIGFYRSDTGAVMGTISNGASNTVSYNTSSDYRLKENVQPMTGALEKVSLLRPVTWTWKGEQEHGEGFIAHEVQAIVPCAVTGEKDAVDENGQPKYQGIDTGFLVATLTAAIKEQQALIESLTTRLAALEAK